jgi:hypothetical protein
VEGPILFRGTPVPFRHSPDADVTVLDAAEKSLADGVIQYINTDLDLTSREDLTALASTFEAGGVFPLQVWRDKDGMWCACFETSHTHTEPDSNIAAMLAVVDSLPPPLRSVWAGCSRREFNIGYDCGLEPWAFNQGLSVNVIGRMAAAGASLRVTLYPDRGQGTAVHRQSVRQTPP